MSNFWDNDPVAPAAKASPNFWDADSVTEHPSIAADVAKSGGIGLAKAAIGLAGLPGDAAELTKSGADWVGGKLPSIPQAAPESTLGRFVQFMKDESARSANGVAAGGHGDLPGSYVPPSSAQLQKGIEGVTGEFYKPKTVWGEYAQTGGEFAPGILAGGQGLLARLAKQVIAPAVTSETAGQLTKGTAAEPYARIVGALASPAITSIGRRVVTPLPASAERTALADTLRGEGVNLTAGQATGSKPLQWAESTLGDMPFSGGGAARAMERQGDQFTAAALRRVGETGNRANSETINNAFNRIGNQFETIGARNHVLPDAQFITDLRTARDEYHNLVGPHARAPVVDNTIADIADQMRRNGGVLNGDQYNAMTSRLGKQARSAKADPQLQEALQGLKESLDDAFERTLHATGNVADHAALREARNQYRNLMVVEKAATGAGSNAAEGLISPSGLRNAVVQQNRRSYARGRGDFADLARSGEALLKPLPNSGTAPRLNMQHALSTLGSVVGGTAGSVGGPGGAVGGALAGFAAPAAAGRVLMSRPVQAYLGNQALLPGARDNVPSALTRALLAGQGMVPYRGANLGPLQPQQNENVPAVR